MRWIFTLFFYMAIVLHAKTQTLPLGESGSVQYTYNNQKLIRIDRLSPSADILYTHAYQYGKNGQLISESLIGNLGEVLYTGDLTIITPFSTEICEYNDKHHLIRHTQDGIVQEYTYKPSGALEHSSIECIYDHTGNVLLVADTQLRYDDANRLIQVVTPDATINYTYNEAGARISRSAHGETESYLYWGINEIAILDQTGTVKELRIPGLSTHKDIIRPIAIETRDAIYAPIHNILGNITKLINIATREVISLTNADPFGNDLPKESPTAWIFAGKHYDREANLVYFGHRYYSPKLQQWLTVDPLQQTTDPYQYCLNNPFSYVDPDGAWAITLLNITWGAVTTITSPLWAPYAAAVATGSTLGYLGYQAYQAWLQKHEPPYNGKKLGRHSGKSPGDGFEWYGSGKPGSKQGGWFNRSKKHSLRADFDHAGDIKPHWDYTGPNGEKARLFLDGSFEWKPQKNRV